MSGGEEESNIVGGRLGRYHVIDVIVSAKEYVDRRQLEEYRITFVIFLLQTSEFNPKPQLNTPQNNWSVIYKSVKVMEVKGRLKETKET